MKKSSIFLTLLPTLVGGAVPATAQIGASYNTDRLYNETSEHSSFNVEVMRGMDFGTDASGTPTELFAIHSYQSSVVHFDLPSSPTGVIEPNKLDRWKTITDPVSIAVTADSVYVLGQGSHALAKHNRSTGMIDDVMMLTSGKPNALDLRFKLLGSEPADMVLNQAGNIAYVSLMGADAVVEIDLVNMSEVRRWQPSAPFAAGDLMWKRPRFLALDEVNDALYVAPFLSGNGTFVMRDNDNRGDGHDAATGLSTGTVISADVFGATGLPDQDLFKVDLGGGDVFPIATKAGSLLMGHGIRGGEYWMLGIQSLNADFESEPSMQGQFAKNVLTRYPNAGFLTSNPSGLPITGTTEDLDEPTPSGVYSSARSIPFPYALEFGGPAGVTAVGSSTLSRVALYSTAGNSRSLINLASASDPGHRGEVIRSLAFGPGDDLYIYCQQTSSIVVWPLDAAGTPATDASHAFDLGGDPTAKRIAEGRAHFYDAKRSQDSRFTCATCHPGGESDVLNWELKDGLTDFKDPMLTQTLKGLRETFPYHWRGERSLSDFNDAFHGLLGASSTPTMMAGLTEDELAAFEDFIFSLRPAANPHAFVERTMQRNFQPLGSPVAGSSASGLVSYENNASVGGTCAACHPLPTGGMGLATRDNISGDRRGLATNANIETIQLSNFLQAREQPIVTLRSNGVGIERSFLGSGFRHDSSEKSLFGFLNNQFGPGGTSSAFVTEAQVGEVAAFIQAMDTSTPPGVHAAVHWSSGGNADELDLINNLLDQADEGWIDVVAFGMGPATGASSTATDLSWVYVPETPSAPGVWRPEDRSNAALLNRDALTSFASSDLTFLGALRGQGTRLGVDYDNDLLVNNDEALFGTDPWETVTDVSSGNLPDGYKEFFLGTGPDSSPPSFLVNPFVVQDFTNGSTALVKFVTNEPVTWKLTATAYETDVTDGTTSVSTRFDVAESEGTTFGRVHTAHIHGIGPSFHTADGGASGTALLVTWEIQLDLLDLSGNPLTLTMGQIDDNPMPAVEIETPTIITGLVVNEFQWDASKALGMISNGVFVGTAELDLRRFSDSSNMASIEDLIVFAQVQKRDPLEDDPWVAVPNAQLRHTAPNYVLPNTVNPTVEFLTVDGGGNPVTITTDYSALIGDAPSSPLMVLGATDSNGVVPPFTVVVFGIDPGDEVRIQIVTIVPEPEMTATFTYDPQRPIFGELQAGFSDWIMPMTIPRLRTLVWPQ